jgi:GntR family transcriptional repressor for pyruvate dehydrogenase complex
MPKRIDRVGRNGLEFTQNLDLQQRKDNQTMARKPIPQTTKKKETTREFAPREKSDRENSRRALKTAEVIALEIVRSIVEQRLSPGDRLPLETELLKHYRVSRSSLREALRLLETQGLIAIRPGPGSGTVVGQAKPQNLGRTMTLFFHMANVTYDDLLNSWILTEPMLAALAAKNPNRELKQRLLGRFVSDSKVASPEQRAIPTGLAFHDAVSELANNDALSMIFRAIGFIVSDHMFQTKDRSALEDFIIDDHSALAATIIAGKPTLARRLMT